VGVRDLSVTLDMPQYQPLDVRTKDKIVIFGLVLWLVLRQSLRRERNGQTTFSTDQILPATINTSDLFT
jgi:hypothetical protein